MGKKYFFAISYFCGLTRLAGWFNRKQVMILCYHCVTPRRDLISADPWKMFLDAGLFDRQLEFLHRNYNVISLQEYLDARRAECELPPRSVVLTFDDGKRNFLTVTAPSLAKLNLPATTFVVVNNTEKAVFPDAEANPSEWKPSDDYDDLSWEDVDILLKNNKIEVGSHTLTHPVLTEITPDEAETELKLSYEQLRRRINSDDLAIAYPHGQASEAVMKIAAATGYSCGLVNTDAGNDFQTDLFRLNRTVINSDDDLSLFAARVAGITWRLLKIKKSLLKVKTVFSNERKLKLSIDFIKNIFL